MRPPHITDNALGRPLTIIYLTRCARRGAAAGSEQDDVLRGGLVRGYGEHAGQAVAMKKAGRLYYLHRDRLGRVAPIGDGHGKEVASPRYRPFGGVRSSTGTLPTDRLFTGQIRDLGDDRMYFFKSRYYDATIGKFQTPDTIVPDFSKPMSNPQQLNRYAYVLNDPLRLVDPSGHDPRGWFNQQWVDAFRAAHHGQNPGPSDYAYRLASMLGETGTQDVSGALGDLQSVDWMQALENSANLGLAWGTGKLAEEFRWVGPFLRGGIGSRNTWSLGRRRLDWPRRHARSERWPGRSSARLTSTGTTNAGRPGGYLGRPLGRRRV